jgi:DNA-binding IclR family transcriptional regulator
MTGTIANAELDSRILRILDQSPRHATSFALARTLQERRDRISDRLKAMKRAGLVEFGRGVWSRARVKA